MFPQEWGTRSISAKHKATEMSIRKPYNAVNRYALAATEQVTPTPAELKSHNKYVCPCFKTR